MEVIPTAAALDVGREEERFMVDVDASSEGECDFEAVGASPASMGPEAQRRTTRAGKPRLATLTTISLLLQLSSLGHHRRRICQRMAFGGGH